MLGMMVWRLLYQKIAIKTEQPRADLFISKKRPDISQEAFLHAQVNKRKNFSNVFLHAYRYHTVNELFASPETILVDPLHEWRYYLEFCSRDTLAELHMKYRAWGYHLPESFIWWIFYWLVRSCKSFDVNDQQPFLDSSPKGFMNKLPSSFLLHNDITWWNVLLQHEDENRRGRVFWDRYPAPKFADYGLSQVKTRGGQDHTASRIKAGTPWFAPPVSIMRKDIQGHADFAVGKEKDGDTIKLLSFSPGPPRFDLPYRLAR